MRQRIREQEIAKHLIDKMFEIAGYDVRFKDITGRQDNWYQQWTMTRQQQEEWMTWGAEFMKDELRIPKYLAERKMDMFNFNYGLMLDKKSVKNKTV